MHIRNLPIGVFDSGIGGLTVINSLMQRLPYESLIYFGDTARVPYGTKSTNSITRFSREIVEFLLNKKVKMIVVACNTVCASSLHLLSKEYRIPMAGVIQPGSKAAVGVTNNNKIGVIGTTRTINSGAYEIAIKSLASDIQITSLACPLFVPLVEEGWTDDPIATAIATKYLIPLKDKDIDTLVLGCTHYPLLKSAIGYVMGSTVNLVDPANETAKEVENQLVELNIKSQNTRITQTTYEYYVSDSESKFFHSAQLIIDKPIRRVTQVELCSTSTSAHFANIY